MRFFNDKEWLINLRAGDISKGIMDIFTAKILRYIAENWGQALLCYLKKKNHTLVKGPKIKPLNVLYSHPAKKEDLSSICLPEEWKKLWDEPGSNRRPLDNTVCVAEVKASV